MRGFATLVQRVVAMFRHDRREEVLDEEVRFHLDMETNRGVQAGLSPETARRAAIQSFGGVEQVKEAYRDRRGLPGLESLGRDLGHALRTLRRSPGYLAVGVLSLALGIGANTAVFTLLDAFVLRPLPYPDPDRLVLIYEAGYFGERFGWGSVAAPVLRDWRERSRAFTAMGAFVAGNANIQDADGATRVAASVVEAQVFHAMGVPPLLGRYFAAESPQTGLERAVVLSHRFWQERFGGSPSAIGQMLRIDAVDHVVVGVMPAGFEFPPRQSVAFWLPLSTSPFDFHDRGLKRLNVIARVRPGLSTGVARSDMQRVSRELEALYRDSHTAWLRPLHGDTVGRTALVLAVLAGTVGFVLLLACANVAHMVLARANARRHEFAVRLALGASRVRIVRLLLAEGIVLAVLGGILGLSVCRWVIDALLAVEGNPLAAGVTVSIGWRVLVYCTAISVATALGVSLVPALRLSRQPLQADLAEALPSAKRRARHGHLLITVEVALALTLVVGAGLMVRSLRALPDLDLGFDPERLLTMRLTLPTDRYPDTPSLHQFYDRMLERIAAVPGVRSAGLNNLLPIQMAYTNMDFTVEGRPNTRVGHTPFAEHRTIDADFFRTMGIPLLAGRPFTAAENRSGSGVIVISRTAATRYWPNQDPIGRRLAYGTKPNPERWFTIIGVAGDIRSGSLGRAPVPILYAPYRDFDFPIRSVSVVARFTGDPQRVGSAIRRAVREMDPDLAPYWVSSMHEVIAQSTTGTRFLAVLVSAFCALAVLLASIGVYGVMSYAVGERHREIGVRIALGASRPAVVRFVLTHVARRAGVGVAIGFLWAVMLSQAMQPFLIGIAQVDPVTHGLGAMAVLGVVLAASALPAWRAARVEPVRALRHQ